MAHPFDLARLFAEHRDELQRFAQRRLGNREAAADLVQDTFVRFAAAVNGAVNSSNAGSAAEIDNPRAFLFRITGNLASGRLLQRGVPPRRLGLDQTSRPGRPKHLVLPAVPAVDSLVADSFGQSY